MKFALEAKCKQPDSGSGVRETSRLISPFQQRQFGILVTTSYVAEQAYKEILEDGHPVVIVSGVDIAKTLLDAGYGSRPAVRSWLEERFPDKPDS